MKDSLDKEKKSNPPNFYFISHHKEFDFPFLSHSNKGNEFVFHFPLRQTKERKMPFPNIRDHLFVCMYTCKWNFVPFFFFFAHAHICLDRFMHVMHKISVKKCCENETTFSLKLMQKRKALRCKMMELGVLPSNPPPILIFLI